MPSRTRSSRMQLTAHKASAPMSLPTLSTDFSAFAFHKSASPVVVSSSPSVVTSSTCLFQTKGNDHHPITPTSTDSSQTSPSTPKQSSITNTTSTSSDEKNVKVETTTVTPPSSKKRRMKSPSSSRKRRRIPPNSVDPPKDFVKLYSLVQELRRDRSAPVDVDGPHTIAETHHGPVVHRFQILISLMLSSQTKDAVVGQAMRNLQDHGLSLHNIHYHTSDDQLHALIQKVGFHNNKTKYIRQMCAMLILDKKYDNDIPHTATDLMTLPGVGPKMAYIVEYLAFQTATGIGVDTHMHRMFKQLKWVDPELCTTPEKTREHLESWLPREYWGEINFIWVGLGQEVTQQKEKILRKCIDCSRPVEAFGLLKRLGMDCMKEAKRYGMEEEVKAVFFKTEKTSSSSTS